MDNQEASSLEEMVKIERLGQMGAVMKMKEARAKAIEEGATPESVGATHPWALPVNPADIVVPRAKLCPQMDPREIYTRIFQTPTSVVQGTTHLPEGKRNGFKAPCPHLEN